MNAKDAIDLSGLKCPIPALRTKKYLKQLRNGDLLEVICTDPLSEIDIPFVVLQTGNRLVSQHISEDGKYHFLIESSGGIRDEKAWPQI